MATWTTTRYSDQMNGLFPFNRDETTDIDSLIIGSGRFIRAVLVPILVEAGYHPAIVQTRGRTFLDYCWREELVEYYTEQDDRLDYCVETVDFDGSVQTDEIPFWGAGTLGSPEGKKAVLDMLAKLENRDLRWKPFVLGVGVTEAGMASANTKAMQDLYDVLYVLDHRQVRQKICIVNSDNVNKNGEVLHSLMNQIAIERRDGHMQYFLKEECVFHNTMVDRITSMRPGNGLVPRAEPIPRKALVLEDLHNNIPDAFSSKATRALGLVVRKEAGMLCSDTALKLRVCNGTHTALAHCMALAGLTNTEYLHHDTDNSKLIMELCDSMFHDQIVVAVREHAIAPVSEAEEVWYDWRKRILHGHFGLSTFFITQNGAAKGGIRIGPTITDLISRHGRSSMACPVSCSTAFVLASILRFLTPAFKPGDYDTVYVGRLDHKAAPPPAETRDAAEASLHNDAAVEYANGLSYNLETGYYSFKCDCEISVGAHAMYTKNLPQALFDIGMGKQPVDYEGVVKAYLIKPDGGDLSSITHSRSFDVVVKAVSALYARMNTGDEEGEGMFDVMKSMDLHVSCQRVVDGPCYMTGTTSFDPSRPLHFKPASIPDDSPLMHSPLDTASSYVSSSQQQCVDTLRAVVVSEVASAVAIDLHTHLLPPTHGALCLWGIDELLTYHYLVAEYFVTAPPSVTPENFYALTKQKQADIIWQALFVDRSPVSEACRGIITTCVALGLSEAIRRRDLEAIREFYRSYREKGRQGAEDFSKRVFEKSGIDYAVMTNIPFEPTETQHWRPTPKDYSKHFRSACRVDPLLAGNTAAVENALKAAGYETTLEGARQFLHDWCDTMKPEYLMASTPHDFVLPEDLGTAGSVRESQKTGVNEEAMKQPFAFANLVASSGRNSNNNKNANNINNNDCGATCGQELASVIDEDSDFLTDVLMRVCEERDLPLALKIGAHRGVNPKLQQAGDGVVAFADAGVLARLCTRFPKVRFLATFLSRVNQHEACVLATKFRNLHLYGCWWFCNNPSIIEEITKMRVEMLGTAFTAQHSDSRVLDQLLYKWPHSRAILADVFYEEYAKLIATGGWAPTRGEIRRDVRRWFGASYEEFLNKSLV